MSKSANYILRLSVAFAFLYPPVDALLEPDAWIGYFPGAVQSFALAHGIPSLALLHGFGLIEVIIALWILWGWRGWVPAVAAIVVLGAIVALDFSDFQILFRDVSIAAAALALAVDFYRRDVIERRQGSLL